MLYSDICSNNFKQIFIMKKLLFLCICIGITFATNAQTEDKKWGIGVNGGVAQYNGDFGRDWYQTDKPFYGFGGITVSRYLWDYLDVNLSYARGTVGYDSGVTGFKSDFSSMALNLKFNLFSPKHIIRPYVFGGIGAILFDSQLNFHKEKIDRVLPSAGGGINFRLSPVVSLYLQESFMFTNNDGRDGVVAGKNDDFLFHTVGMTFNLGNSKDTDGDGVSDKKDKCPDTPASVVVDKFGCPLDKDADGISDYLDACPDISGSKALNGCPDKDNDGVEDSKDRCPEQAGLTSLAGCPDADKDGVADMDDACANTKLGTKVDAKGCALDSDNDGVSDDLDRCPNVAGVLSLKGCPDADGDGIADLDDKCPNAKGTLSNKGCPEIAPADIVRITYIGSKIFFENNSDKLKVASLSQLDELSKILYKYDGASLIIEGHTDSVGANLFNMTLSQKRAESVRQYLIGKGILETRLSSVGFGETKPVASNTTTLGKAKNRRVELKTNY